MAAFDHGAAPPGYSDRRFRFDYIRQAVASRPEPVAFAYVGGAVPPDLTRLAAVADDAARYGEVASDPGHAGGRDRRGGDGHGVGGRGRCAGGPARARGSGSALVVNVGNFHTLAFHLRDGQISGIFEHHTGELTRPKLEAYLRGLAAGTITDDEVFADSGHGALVLGDAARRADAGAEMPLLAVTGPRRELLRGSALAPYEAVPHGDMMLAGCFGLLRAVAARLPETAGAIAGVLGPAPR